MKKYISIICIFCVVIGSLILVFRSISVTTDSEIDSALQTILKNQNVTQINQLNCSKISDTDLENIGDAYMGLGLNDNQHDAIHNLMGGEGSSTLQQAHINMGRAYLGCWSNFNGAPAKSISLLFSNYSLYRTLNTVFAIAILVLVSVILFMLKMLIKK